MRRKRDGAGCCAMSALVLLTMKVIQQAASGCFHVTCMHLPVIGYTLIVVFLFLRHFCFHIVLAEMILTGLELPSGMPGISPSLAIAAPSTAGSRIIPAGMLFVPGSVSAD